MEAEKTKKKKPVKVVVADTAKETPRRYFLKSEKVWVGIGGPVDVIPSPPKPAYRIPEATEKQYLQIAKTNPLVNTE